MPVKMKWQENGFTLVEAMVALTLLSILFVTVYTFFISGVISCHRNQDKAEVEENLRIGINRLTRELRQAKSIHSFDPVSGGRLQFTNQDGDIIRYSCSTSGDSERAYQLIRAINGTGNNPVARYIKQIYVQPDNCGPDTGLITVSLSGEKEKSGILHISTTIKLRLQD